MLLNKPNQTKLLDGNTWNDITVQIISIGSEYLNLTTKGKLFVLD